MNTSMLSERTIGGIPIKNFSKDFTDSSSPHDRILVVEGQKFYVYTGLLSFCSEFFRTMFTSDFKEKYQDEIAIGDVTAESFHLYLQMLVPGNHSAIEVNNFSPIMACARRFMSPEVLSLCEKFLIENYDELDEIELLKIAFEYNLDKLKDKLASDMVQDTSTNENCQNNCSSSLRRTYCSGCGNFLANTPGILNKTSILAKHEKGLSDLPDEINAFVLKALLKHVNA